MLTARVANFIMPRKVRHADVRDLNDYWFDGPKARNLWSRRRIFEDSYKMILGPEINPATRRLLLEMHCLGTFTKTAMRKLICEKVESVLNMLELQQLIVRAGRRGTGVVYTLSPWGRMLLLEFVREAEYFIWRSGGRLRLQCDAPIPRPAPQYLAQAVGGISTQASPATASDPPKE